MSCIVNEAVKDLTSDNTSHTTDNDEQITTYKSRLTTLTDNLSILKDEIIKQGKYYQLESQSLILLNQQFTTFYVSSSIRSHLLSQYNTSQYALIEQYKHYSEQLYNQCVKPLDGM